MRRRNLSLVLHTVATHGPISRAGVASRIGLTRSAVSTLVEELDRAGLLVELGPGRPGTVGRPGSELALSESGPAGLGAEIGVDRLAVCAVDLRGRVRVRAEEPAAHRGSAPGPVLRRLARLCARVAADAGREGLRPAGLTVAVPGLVARDAATVVRAPNLGWEGLDARAPLAQALTLPVTVANEANIGALAELWCGGHSPAPRDFVYVSAEIGIGAAVVVDGALLRGAHGFAGELGHVPVRPQGLRCACGGRGCLERYAGEEAVLRAAGIDERGPAGVAELRNRAGAGDGAARRALRGAGAALGTALAGVVNLLDPEAVVLGGALTELAPWVVPAAERELRRHVADPARAAHGGIVVSGLGRDAALLGAARSVVQDVLDDPLGAAPAPA
ncbi:ROK family transcriptional regulator [Streptomyces zingiberis]|uniref:ROK family protein n=1 Tax=Streptomyces zingiberis TaxID=2053010 RepID=A0ABX1BXA6_9ACTN|nr:ROK family transcriptional regulator [Streptomyces zingiberis]NJQ00117.1 ROK family protein [Streptomyces zingiberis]